MGHSCSPILPIGPYRLTVTAPSFQTYAQSGITLQVGNNVQVNAALTLGSVSQSVEVVAGAAMVETQNTSISEVIDERRILDLPFERGFEQATDLILLAGAPVFPATAARPVLDHSRLRHCHRGFHFRWTGERQQLSA